MPVTGNHQLEVIDLLSDDSDFAALASADQFAPPPLPFFPFAEGYGDNIAPGEDVLFNAAGAPEQLEPKQAFPQPGLLTGGQIVNIDGEDVFIPDEEHGQTQPKVQSPAAELAGASTNHDAELAIAIDGQTYTADDCLRRLLEVFPDISHDYVIGLYNDFDNNKDSENVPGSARFDNIVDRLISAISYPKQGKGKEAQKKRKREDSFGEESLDKQWKRQDRDTVPTFCKGSMQAMLKAEFPDITIQTCNGMLARHKHLYQAYIEIAKARDSEDETHPVRRGRASKTIANADTIGAHCGWPPLLDELQAARRRIETIKVERALEDAKKKVEQENLQRAMEAGETAECSACFDELPMNRQIHCDGTVVHFTCYDCATTYIKSEVGESRCRVLCPAGCGAPFAPNQLNLLSDKQLLEKLAELEQEKAIRDADLNDLEECPFCEYKAILPPIEEDFEFRCANPECEKVSCRRCKSVSHIPISCEQHAKDTKINSRHKIEEAMTAALIRSCNKCKKQFIKEYGCNKMTCPSCSNMQCYVCSETLTTYDHFDQGTGRVQAAGSSGKKGCPLYDNVEERHEREVKEAEAAARAQVTEEHPDLSTADLEIKVSDAVKKATADRIKRAGGPAGGLPPDFAGFGPDPQRMFRVAVYGNDGAQDDFNDDGFNAIFGGDFGAMPARLRRWREAVRERRGAPQWGPIEPQVALQAPPAPIPQPGNALPMQGFIPVFGLPPAQHAPAPYANAPHANAPPAAAPPRAPVEMPNFFGPFPNYFLGGDAGQDGIRGVNPLHRPANELPGLPDAHPVPQPRHEDGQDRRQQRDNFQQLEQMRQQHNDMMLRRQQQRQRQLLRQQQLLRLEEARRHNQLRTEQHHHAVNLDMQLASLPQQTRRRQHPDNRHSRN